MFHSEDVGKKMSETINRLSAEVREHKALANEYARQLALSDQKYLDVAEMLLKVRNHHHGWNYKQYPFEVLHCPVCRGIYMLAPHRLRPEILELFEGEADGV